MTPRTLPMIAGALVAAALVAAAAHLLLVRRGDLSPAEAWRLVHGGALLVDVRTPAEFTAGHVSGAVNLPVGELPGRMSELPRDRALVLYCRSGHRSGHAAKLLKEAGFHDVHNLGAMGRWPDVAATPAP